MPSRRSARSARGDSWARCALLLAALLGAASAAAGTTIPKEPFTVLTKEAIEGHIELYEGWRYHPGDDPSWASPGFDDGAWPVANSKIPDPAAMPGGWTGIGWFRRKLELGPGIGSTILAMGVDQLGASDIYLDGHLVTAFGTVSAQREGERAWRPRRFVGLVLDPGTAHVLAVRFSNAAGNHIYSRMRGFVIGLRTVESASARWVAIVRNFSAALAFIVGVFGSFTLIYLLLWAFRRKSWEYLVFALFTGFLAGNFCVEFRLEFTEDVTRALWLFGLLAMTSVGIVLSGLALEHVVFRRRPSWWTWLIGALGAGLVVWTFTWTSVGPIAVVHVYILLGSAEMLRVAVAAMRRQERDAWIVAGGLGALMLAVVVSQVAQLLEVKAPVDILFAVGLFVLVLSLSVYLSRRVARTQRELEERLIEVQALTARAVGQERRAAAEEAEKRLLAAENERKTRELEDARQMQLAMLPPSSPSHGRYDIAFRMATATEVGGDYVDIAPCGDGGIQVALGDATSHGLQAGIVVAVAKSLFQTSREERSPGAVLHRVAEGLAALRERRASMALAVLRLDGSSVRLASAGMPPLLVFRKEAGQTEEVLLPGMPLGTKHDAPWEEREIRLASGDALLAMTDGLAESVDSAGEQFGYDRASALFASLAGRDATGIADGMLAGAVSFLGGAGLEDDFTVVALKVR
jgi:serine phosphatase RsbU (regulator of sigma subunit)